MADILAAAQAVGMEILPVEARTPDNYPAAFAAVTSGRAHALIANGNPGNFKTESSSRTSP